MAGLLVGVALRATHPVRRLFAGLSSGLPAAGAAFDRHGDSPQPNLGILYAAIATVSSVLGSTVTYYIGRLGGRPLAERFVSRERIEAAEDFFQNHGAITMGIAAFTPIPYPPFVLAAGISHLGVWRFVLASLVGRGARFFGMGLAIFFFGPSIQRFLEDYLGWATLIVGILIVVAYVVGRYTNARFEKQARNKEG